MNEEKTFVENYFAVEDLYTMLCTMFYFVLFIVTQANSVVMSLSSYAWGLFQLIF